MFVASMCILGLVAFLALFWVAWVEPRSLRIVRYQTQLRNLSSPFRAIVVADIQPNAYHWPASRLKSVFKDVNTAENPDFVFWLGDYFNAPTDKMKELFDRQRTLRRWVDAHLPRMRDIAEAMAELRGRVATIAVLGNHDWAWSGASTQRRLEEFGIRVLKDEIVNAVDPQSGQSIAIVGYEDVSSGRVPNFAVLHSKLDNNQPQIALSHSPDAFQMSEDGPPIMISGHTHGGQIRLPLFGPILLPVKNREFDRGWFVRGSRMLFVSSGLGTSLPPVRLLCPPEIVVIDFVPEDEVD